MSGFPSTDNEERRVTEELFGTLEDGRNARLFTLANRNGLRVRITNYGGIITSIDTPDSEGDVRNVALGLASVEQYEAGHPFFGALIGRYANRIADGTFDVDGTTYRVTRNAGGHLLHGGQNGFDKVLWAARITGESELTLSYHSADGEEGFPGNLDVAVVYSLSDDNELKIAYRAETDKATPITMTNHTYFNLSGNPATPVLSHQLQLSAEHYTPAAADRIPTGEIAAVRDTPFDFTAPRPVGERIDEVDGNYDENFVLSRAPRESPHWAATLYSPESGREMRVSTTEPGVQLYTAKPLDGSLKSPDGVPYQSYAGLCLETQHFPNSPNEPRFPSTILRPNETFHSITVYQFGVR